MVIDIDKSVVWFDGVCSSLPPEEQLLRSLYHLIKILRSKTHKFKNVYHIKAELEMMLFVFLILSFFC